MDLPFGLKDLRGVFQPKWFRDSMNVFVTVFLRVLLLHCQKQGIEISQIKQILNIILPQFRWVKTAIEVDKDSQGKSATQEMVRKPEAFLCIAPCSI